MSAAVKLSTIDRGGLIPTSPSSRTVIVAAQNILGVDPAMEANVARYKRHYGLTDHPAAQSTRTVLRHLLNQRGKAVLSVPCGLDKTTGALGYLAAHARSKRKFWLVRDLRASCRKSLADLRRLGVKDCVMLSGYEKCLTGAAPTHHIAYGPASPCKACPVQTKCTFGATRYHLRQLLRSAVVCMTHQKFIRLVHAGQVPPDVEIIIDEQLPPFADWQMTASDFELVEIAVAHDHHRQSLRVDEAVSPGTHIETCHLTAADQRRIHAFLHRHPRVPNATVDRLLGYSQFFGAKNQGKCFRMPRSPGEWQWKRRHMDLGELPNAITVLDASAEVGEVQWTGFTTYKVQEHGELNYGNVRLHTFPGLPTKARWRKISDANGATYGELFARQAGTALSSRATQEKVLVVADKCATREMRRLQRELLAAGHPVVKMTRGSTRGTNQAADAATVVIGCALFTSVVDYALSASLATGEEVAGERIWQGSRPRMNASGFVDPALNQAYQHACVVQIYQTLCRGRVRQHRGLAVDVYAFCSDIGVLVALDRLMPGYRVAESPAARQLETIRVSHRELRPPRVKKVPKTPRRTARAPAGLLFKLTPLVAMAANRSGAARQLARRNVHNSFILTHIVSNG